MPEYRLSLDFTAADDQQAQRLAEAWAGTCAAEYDTRYAGVERIAPCRHSFYTDAVGNRSCGECHEIADRVHICGTGTCRDVACCCDPHNPSASGTYPLFRPDPEGQP